MRHETAVAMRIQKARTTLLLDHPFFGTLLFRLKGRETHSVATMATDGVSLFYNPAFVDTLTLSELVGVLSSMHLPMRNSSKTDELKAAYS